jgi:thioredoxin-like negative regulator of GroEL
VRRGEVDELWEEMRASGPTPEIMVEGRIVAAASKADTGQVREAIALLEQGPVRSRRPEWHHLRLWYALADLYERAGDVPRARDLFARVAGADPEFADVAQRLAGLD